MAIPAGEMLFLDTNILVAATENRGRSTRRPVSSSAPDAPQDFTCDERAGHREYLVVATRPLSANGLGLSPADALGNIGKMTRTSSSATSRIRFNSAAQPGGREGDFG